MKLVHKIAKVEALRKSLWAKACKHEGIPVDSRFVMFSDDNPYHVASGRAVILRNNLLRPRSSRLAVAV